jgi:hypothetical protein
MRLPGGEHAVAAGRRLADEIERSRLGRAFKSLASD